MERKEEGYRETPEGCVLYQNHSTNDPDLEYTE